MTDLTALINAEIDKDVELSHGEDEQEHAERHWPDRIERQAAALRRILARHKPITREYPHPVCSRCRKGKKGKRVEWPCPEIRDLLAIYDLATETPTPTPMRVTTTSASFIAPPEWIRKLATGGIIPPGTPHIAGE